MTWTSISRETARETQAMLEELLGLTRETFRASAFLAQGDGAAFTEAEPRERKRILAEILGLHVWDRLLEQVRADRAGLEKELQRLAGRLELAETELADRPAAVAERDAHAVERDTAGRALTDAEEALAAAVAAEQEARTRGAQRAAAERTVAERTRTYEDTARRIDRLNAEHMELQEQLAGKAGLERVAARVGELERMEAAGRRLELLEDELGQAGAVVERAQAEQDAADRQLATVETAERAECPMCGQELHDQARANTLRELLARRDGWGRALVEASERVETLNKEIESATRERGDLTVDVDRELRDARAAQATLAALAQAERRLAAIADQSAHEVTALVAQEHAAQEAREQLAGCPDPGDLSLLEQHARDARVTHTARQTRVQEIDRAIARCDERLERYAQLEQAVAADREARDRLHDDTTILAQLERAFGRDGIPALILENAAIPQIETEANRILDELGTGYRVTLETQKLTKTGDVRDALDIIVTDHGVERPYETFSGGERTRLNLSLRIALARLLAHRRGAQVRMLAIDEPEYLDEAGMDALVRVLRGLTDFDTTVVVSHHPGLRDAFDQMITVVNEDGRSLINGAGVPAVEAVA